MKFPFPVSLNHANGALLERFSAYRFFANGIECVSYRDAWQATPPDYVDGISVVAFDRSQATRIFRSLGF